MKKIILYTKKGCPYCLETKKLLKCLNISFSDYELDPNNPKYNSLKEQTFKQFKHYSFPIIIADKDLIGGYTELYRLYKNNELFPFLTSS